MGPQIGSGDQTWASNFAEEKKKGGLRGWQMRRGGTEEVSVCGVGGEGGAARGGGEQFQ